MTRYEEIMKDCEEAENILEGMDEMKSALTIRGHMRTYTINGREYEIIIRETGGNDRHIPENLPKGTKLDQWIHYAVEMGYHEVEIGRQRTHLELFLNYLQAMATEYTMPTMSMKEIRDFLNVFIERAAHMDGPTRPGGNAPND